MSADDGMLPRYDTWAGDLSLRDPQPNDVDRAIADYVRADPPTAARAVTGVTDGYTLLAFARRSAVLSLREHDSGRATLGLDAMAAIDSEQVDPRDLLVALAILHHSLSATEVDVDGLFRDAARNAAPSTAASMTGYLHWSPAERHLRDAWGLVQIETDGGPGLIGWGFQRWEPTADMAAASLAIADVLTGEDYRADDPMLAIDMASFWLSGVDDDAVDAILGRSVATASVGARMRPHVDDASDAQQLTAFIVEAATDDDDARLIGIADRVDHDFVATTASDGRLFCQLIARSFVDGVEGVEDAASIARFRRPIQRVLKRYAG